METFERAQATPYPLLKYPIERKRYTMNLDLGTQDNLLLV